MTSPYLVHSTIAPIIGTVLNGQTKVLHLNHLWRNNNVVNMANMNMPLKRVVSLFLTNLHQRLTVRSTKVSWIGSQCTQHAKTLGTEMAGESRESGQPALRQKCMQEFCEYSEWSSKRSDLRKLTGIWRLSINAIWSTKLGLSENELSVTYHDSFEYAIISDASSLYKCRQKPARESLSLPMSWVTPSHCHHRSRRLGER